MQNYLTVEEAAQHLRVEEKEVMNLITDGRMKAIKIGDSVRIPETEFESLLTTCAIESSRNEETAVQALTDGTRWVPTRTGRSRFRVAGSIRDGAEIWLGRMRYPIKIPREFTRALLSHFDQAEVAVGGSFDGPTPGSLGEFIQRELPTRMNPAVFVAALLINEGYAVATRRGYIRFLRSPVPK